MNWNKKSENMKVIIVHGWQGCNKGHWQEWLYNELKRKGTEAYLPLLPNAGNPIQEKWIQKLKKFEPFNKETILVGHSLGCTTILRLLEQMTETQKVGKVLLVCGWNEGDHGIKEIANFFKTPLNWKKIKEKAKQFIVINSDNDPYFPLEKGKKLAEELGVKCIVEHNAGHINVKSGFGPYPKLLKLILLM